MGVNLSLTHPNPKGISRADLVSAGDDVSAGVPHDRVPAIERVLGGQAPKGSGELSQLGLEALENE